MYCSKCGAEKVNGKCPNCDSSKSIQNLAYNTYVFITTMATMLIIRLTTHKTETVKIYNSWRRNYGTEYYVPSNIKGVMIILLLLSLYVLYKMCNAGKCSKLKTELTMLAEIIIGLMIIFVNFCPEKI